MTRIKLNVPIIVPGDQFASRSKKGLFIRTRDKIRSPDNEATYNHTGILVDNDYKTMESKLKGINYYNLADYIDHKIIIVRPNVRQMLKESAMKKMTVHIGQIYPWWKFFIFAISPALLKYFNLSKILVCSEFDAKYEYFLKIRHRYYMGTTPDMLVDEWRRWKEYDIVFEGVLRRVSDE